MKEIKIGACYLRVSTELQTEYSPNSQLKLIKEYAKKNNIELSEEHIYRDDGISGRHTDKREQFNKMMLSAKKKPKPFDVILVYDFSRFARNREDSIIYKTMLRKKLNIDVISITQPLTQDKNSVIFEALFEAMDEYYSLNLRDNVKRGKLEKATRGEFQGQAPYGYKYSKDIKSLVTVPEKAEIIRNIFKDYTNNVSIADITRKLNNQNIPTTKNKKWEVTYMVSILYNPVYIGKIRYTDGGTKRNYHNPNTIIKDSNHEPIIDIDTWNKAQKKNQTNYELYSHKERIKAKHGHWLSGLVKCFYCGHSLVKHINSFRCNGYCKGQCNHSGYISVNNMETAILKHLKDAFANEIAINVSNIDTEYDNDIATLNATIKKLNERLVRCKNLYLDGTDTLEEYKETKNLITNEINNHSKQLSNFENNKNNSLRKETIYKKCNQAYDIFLDEEATLDIKYAISHKLFDKIVFNKINGELIITYK